MDIREVNDVSFCIPPSPISNLIPSTCPLPFTSTCYLVCLLSASFIFPSSFDKILSLILLFWLPSVQRKLAKERLEDGWMIANLRRRHVRNLKPNTIQARRDESAEWLSCVCTSLPWIDARTFDLCGIFPSLSRSLAISAMFKKLFSKIQIWGRTFGLEFR